jgi:NAD(P)-dependent dehydrogenase (short-subunit alcohol dehydrogenase family)
VSVMNAGLDGKVAVVTGASRGIGLATATRLAGDGAKVLLTSRKAEDLERVTGELQDKGFEVAWKAAHVGDPAQAEAAMATAVERFGSVDILVNNAGTNPYFGRLVDIDLARAEKTVQINQTAVLTWTQAAWRASMSERGGAVVNVASIGGLSVEPGIAWYNVTKAAVIHLTRQLAAELAPKVRVNAVSPGLVRTKLAQALWEGREDAVARRHPMGRIGEPEDIADAICFLVSHDARWITGQNLVVDGGTLRGAPGIG